MIIDFGTAFHLKTKECSYFLSIDKLGKPELLYFGAPLPEEETPEALAKREAPTSGRTVVYDETKDKALSLNDIPSEFSTPWKGDIHNPSLLIEGEEGVVFDFVFVNAEKKPSGKIKGLPTPRGGEDLILHFADKAMKVELSLHYVVYDEGVIGRYCELLNSGKKPLILRKAMSYQICLENKDYILESSFGNWAGEFQKEETKIGHMGYFLGSETGSSGDQHNPFFLLKAGRTSLHHGEAYGFNLLYSGSHREEIQENSFGRIRVMAGISPTNFNYELPPGEAFSSPMGVLAYSKRGVDGVSAVFHSFIKGRVLPSSHIDELRPILYNNWEGTYFRFNEAKLLALAKKAKKLGVELFVLDDGWFGHRNADTTSLGDYSVDKKKLPRGLGHLSKKIHAMGLLFGLWVEPEAISEDSDLYRAHPEFAIQDGKHKPSKGRNQLVLDLTKKEVRDYVVDSLSKTFAEAQVDFIKWDYNRIITDIPGNGAFIHSYILGLYEILEQIRAKFPKLWMENCASGGGRNDLGMLSYFDTCWVSDDTDSFERASIQANMAKGYPPCCMSNHVSAKTSHQMLRSTSFGTKFDVACIGVLGYELNFLDLDPIDLRQIKEQIAFDKAHRKTLQFGRYDLLQEKENGRIVAEMQSEDETIVSYTNVMQTTHPGLTYFPVKNLDPETLYHYEVRIEEISFHRFGSLLNMVLPFHVKERGKLVNLLSRYKAMPAESYQGEARGATLNQGGVPLGPEWAGTGLNNNVRVLGDFGARVYLVQKTVDHPAKAE